MLTFLDEDGDDVDAEEVAAGYKVQNALAAAVTVSAEARALDDLSSDAGGAAAAAAGSEVIPHVPIDEDGHLTSSVDVGQGLFDSTVVSRVCSLYWNSCSFKFECIMK